LRAVGYNVQQLDGGSHRLVANRGAAADLGAFDGYGTIGLPRFVFAKVPAHDPIAVHGLYSLLDQRPGLTFIQAERDFLRSFVLTAIGHAASRIGSSVRPIAGLDQHQEGVFVSVPGVTYLGRLSEPAERQRRVHGLCPLTQSGFLVIINGLWLEFPTLQQQLIAAADTRHIVIADDTQFNPSSLRQILGSSRIPARILMLSELPADRISIHFACASGGVEKSRISD
jgi:hypothetical protein